MDPKQDPYHLLRSCAELLNVPTNIQLEKLDEAYRKLLKETPYETKNYKDFWEAYVTLRSCFQTCGTCGGTGIFWYRPCGPCQGTGKNPREGYADALKSM